MVHDLIGYLLGALDADEAAAVEQALESDPDTRRQLDLLQQGIAPVERGMTDVDVPPDLSAQTCRHVRERGRRV